jgi:imidazole glycerol-phosphate synthase subunit HisH
VPRVSIIDYDLNNLRSLCRAIEVRGGTPRIVTWPDELDDPSHVIIPGVGNFTKAMALLTERGWPAALRQLAAGGQTQILGICLGMQLLAKQGTEGGLTEGLGLVRGSIQRLEAHNAAEHIPHVGWNEVHTLRPSPLFDGIPDRTDFYFVHSYHFVAADPDCVLGTTAHCGGFVAAVQNGNVFGVQFHPEKSSHLGLRLLENFLGLEGPR